MLFAPQRLFAVLLAGLTAVLLVAAVIVAAPATAADRSGRDRAERADVDLRITGRGYGHGRGMSQYGAQGRAIAGQSAGRILDFYYPQTSSKRVHGKIRILLTTPSSRSLVVAWRPGLTVQHVRRDRSWTIPRISGVHRWRLRWDSRSTSTLEMRRRGDWRPAPQRYWRSFGGPGQFVGDATPVRLVQDGGKPFRGALRSYGKRPSDMGVVNVLPIRSYLFGVVPLESPSSWHRASLQAQAVAARTYALYHRRNARLAGRGYDLCDTTACQVYGGAAAEQPSTNAAVRASRGTVRVWQGRPILAEFSSSNGGQTAASSVPYQTAKSDAFDNDVNPYARWTVTIDGARVAAIWNLGRFTGAEVVDRTGGGSWGGRAAQIRLVGSQRTTTISGDDLRLALGLRSNYVRVGTRR